VVQKGYSDTSAQIYIQDAMGQPFDKEAFTALKVIVEHGHQVNPALKGVA